MHKKLTKAEKAAYKKLARAARRVQRLEQRRRRLQQAARNADSGDGRQEVQHDDA